MKLGLQSRVNPREKFVTFVLNLELGLKHLILFSLWGFEVAEKWWI